MARDRNRGAQGQDKLPRTTARTQRLASQRMNLCSYLVYAIAFSHAVPDHLEGALHGERGAECCDTPGVDVVLLFFICTLPLLSLYLVYRVSSEVAAVDGVCVPIGLNGARDATCEIFMPPFRLAC